MAIPTKFLLPRFLSTVFPHPSGNMSILGKCEPGVDSFILFVH